MSLHGEFAEDHAKLVMGVNITIFDGGILSFWLELQKPKCARCKYIEPIVCHVY